MVNCVRPSGCPPNVSFARAGPCVGFDSPQNEVMGDFWKELKTGVEAGTAKDVLEGRVGMPFTEKNLAHYQAFLKEKDSSG